MADIRDVTGQIKLEQARSTARDDTGSFSFIVESITSEPTGFSEPVTTYKPDYFFIFEDSDFVRLASYQDLIEVPAGRPDIPGASYRTNKCTRSFNDVREAIAWSREVYDVVISLTSEIRDYSAVFENVTESAYLPTDFFTQYEKASNIYLSVVAELEVLGVEIDVAKAKQTILDLVYDYSRLENVDESGNLVVSVDVLRTNLPRLRAGLSSISSGLLNAIGANVGGNQSIPDSVTQIREDVVPLVGQIDPQLTEINSDISVAQGKLLAIDTNPAEISAANLLLVNDALTAINSSVNRTTTLITFLVNSSIEATLNTVAATLSNFRNTMMTSETGVDLTRKIITTGDGAAFDVESAVQKLNTLSTVNNAELSKLKAEVDKEVKVKEDAYEGKIKDKEEAWQDVLNLYPDADPDTPLEVLTHRIFAVANDSG